MKDSRFRVHERLIAQEWKELERRRARLLLAQHLGMGSDSNFEA